MFVIVNEVCYYFFYSKLLNNDVFHISLLACALELVMATYGSKFKLTRSIIKQTFLGQTSFPKVFSVIGNLPSLKCYFKCKVL